MKVPLSRSVASVLLVSLICSVQPLPAWEPSGADYPAHELEAFASTFLMGAYERSLSLLSLWTLFLVMK